MNVKKILLVVILLNVFFLAGSVNAQNSIGVRAGGNIGFMAPTFETYYTERLGYSVGVTGHIELIPNLFYIPEINYTRRGYLFFTPSFLDDNLSGTDLILGLNYLDIPFNFGYGATLINEGASDMFFLAYGGFQLNLLQGQRNRYREREALSGAPEGDPPAYDAVRTTDMGGNLGFSVGYSQFLFDLRFFFGVIPLFEPKREGDTMNSVTLSAAYRFIW